MSKYTSKELLENYLLIDIADSMDSQIDDWIEAASEYIEMETGRTFGELVVAGSGDDGAPEPEVRLFDGNGTKQLIVDDFVELVSITIGDDEIDLEDNAYSYPANKTPKTRILLKNNTFARGLQNVEIEAYWGYSLEVPMSIRQAATVLVAGVINQSNSHEGEVQSETIGRYSVTYKTDREWKDFEQAKNTLKHFKRFRM